MRPKLNLAKILASSTSRNPPEEGVYGVGWMLVFRLSDPAWYRDRGFGDALATALAGARWWAELDRFGVGYTADRPLSDVAAVQSALARPEPTVVTLTRDGGEISLELETREATLEVRLRLDGEVLARNRDAVLDDTIDAVTAVRARWSARARLPFANAYPFPANRIDYPRIRPPRTTLWRSDALVDVFDPELTPGIENAQRIDEARALARAPVSSVARREERSGVTVVRWVEDPTDREQVKRGLAAREAWLFSRVETEPALGWNAAGDREVPVSMTDSRVAPLAAIDDEGTGYLELGDDDEAAIRTAADVASKGRSGGSRVGRVLLLAPDRDAALRVGPRVHEAGLRVLYRDRDRLWDPFPPGNWQSSA